MLHADHALALRHERAAMSIEAAFARVHFAMHPDRGSAVAPIADGAAVFAGVGSPMSQATGLGMSGPVADSDLEALEAFYAERGSPARVVVCPHADDSLVATLNRRGYRPVEFENVMVCRLESEPVPTDSAIERIVAGPELAERYAGAVGPNFAEAGQLTPELREMMAALFAVEGAANVLARIDGHDAGGGALLMRDGLAMLAGAGTLPAYRNRGVHAAVFAERLSLARAAGCDLAVMGSRPGSASQRNAERKGFRVAYTKIVVERPL